ncbi:SRPBCC family protein [Schlesneria paludicola]|uniref:SRPBCC family protein n=1 Tax=Schlesneria paludicola TaxID=360056 RepID=UPI000299EDB8|nr:SRPBCC domain-containing protein [Schlesneria paludicola]
MSSNDGMVVIERVFDAPRELVFQAWTDREHLANWYAPNGCTITFKTLEIRPGGVFHSCIRSPEGHECWCKGVYLEIEPPTRIVYSMSIADQDGNLAEPVDVGMDPEWPRETTVTVSFLEWGDKTRLTLHQTVREAIAKRTGAYPSWLQMLDRLVDEVTHH